MATRARDLERRQVVKLGLGLGLGILCGGLSVTPGKVLSASRDMGNNDSQSTATQGCCLQGQGADALIARLDRLSRNGETHDTLIHHSGDDRLDRSLGILLADMSSKMKVRPGFAFYDEGDSPNALAMERSWLPQTRGTVLFGRTLLKTTLEKSRNGDMLVMGICAHEFGHIVQYDQGILGRLRKNQSTNRQVELHADFLGGFYVGLREFEYSPQQKIDLGQSWEELGDSNFTDEYHHGSRSERIAALEAGYTMAKRNQGKVGVREAVKAGLLYLRA